MHHKIEKCSMLVMRHTGFCRSILGNNTSNMVILALITGPGKVLLPCHSLAHTGKGHCKIFEMVQPEYSEKDYSAPILRFFSTRP